MRRCYPWLLFGLSVTLLLSGCGSTATTTRAPVKSSVPQVQTEENTETTLTPAMMVARAQDVWQTTGDINLRNGFTAEQFVAQHLSSLFFVMIMQRQGFRLDREML